MSEFTLIIGNKNYSSWSLRAWIWMGHLGLEFDEKMVRLYQPDTAKNLILEFSNSKVPVLIHQDLEVWDSLAIIEYLAELFPRKGKLKSLEVRAVMRSMCAEMHSSFPDLRNELPMNCRREPSPVDLSEGCLKDIQRIDDLWQFARTKAESEQGFLFGDFSMADAMFAPVVFRFDRFQVKVSAESRAYMDKMLAHAGMQQWLKACQQEPWVIEQAERH